MTREIRFFSALIKVVGCFLSISCICLYEYPEIRYVRGGSSDEETGTITVRVLEKRSQPSSGIAAQLL